MSSTQTYATKWEFLKTKSVLKSLVVILILAALVFIHLRLHGNAHDDAYIHFRIVRNWMEYGVPYYNPSERLMATSSVGWTVILYGFAQISQLLHIADLASWVTVYNALMIGLGAFIYLRLVRQIANRPISSFLAIFFVLTYLSLMIFPSLGLMETPTAILLSGLALLGLILKKPCSLVLFGMLPFFRLELVVLSVLAVIYALVVQKMPVKVLGYLVIGILPFFLFDMVYFGKLIPNTLTAKGIVISLSYLETLSQLILKIIDDLYLLTFLYPYKLSHGLVYFFYAALLIASSILIFVYRNFRRALRRAWAELETGGLLFIAWGLGILGVYLLERVYIFEWYEPLFTIPGLVVICLLMAEVRVKALMWIYVPFLCVQCLSLGGVVLGATVSPIYYPNAGIGARVRQYLHIGQELHKCYPDARLMTSEIGGLGYGFEGYLLDGAGLVTPEALQYHPMAVPGERKSGVISAIPFKFILEENPEIIVSFDIYIEEFLRSREVEKYEEVKLPMMLEADAQSLGSYQYFGSNTIYLFIRRDLIEQKGAACPALGVLP